MGRKDCDLFLNKLGDNVMGKKQSEHLDRLYQRIDSIALKHPQYVMNTNGVATVETTSKYVVSNTTGNTQQGPIYLHIFP